MEQTERKFSWQPVVVYYLLALAISGPFFYWRTMLDWKGFAGPGILKTMSIMWGPGIAGLICYLLYRHRFTKEITVFGKSWLKSVVIWVAPFLLLAALGLKKEGGTDHTTPLIFIGFGFLSIWGEEIGWRWFLQDYLKPLHPMKKYILIGVLWELWHMRFMGKLHDSLLHALVSSMLVLVVTIAISILIGFVADRTKSLTFACALHAWIDMLAEFGQLNTYIAAAAMLVLCAVLVFTGKKASHALANGQLASDLN